MTSPSRTAAGPDGASRDGHLLPLVERLGGTVLAVGDLVLDVYAYGSVARISPEAPIPVLRLASERRMLGGVGNVARNVAALGGAAILAAPVGPDESGETLRGLLAAEHGVRDGLVACGDRPTSRKTRFVASGQQILRADREEVGPIPPDVEDGLLSELDAAIGTCGAMVVSDYGKGALTPRVLDRAMSAARDYGIPVVVDPKRHDFRVYSGASCITPNLAELALGTGLPVATDGEVAAAAELVIARTGAAFVLVTRSERGMSLVGRDGSALHLPARRREVFDVSGAGDTVVAALALALASGVGWADATALANAAAGIVVAKQGTATCSRAELEAELGAHLVAQDRKLRSRAEAAGIAAQWRRLGLKVGFTNGCFDLLHPGHVRVLQGSRERCDRLVVGLNSDASVARGKGPGRPLQDAAARATVLSALGCVDMVVIFDEDTPLDLIGAIRPSVLLKGADYRIEDVVGADIVRAGGGDVVLVDLVPGQSTTGIVARMGG